MYKIARWVALFLFVICLATSALGVDKQPWEAKPFSADPMAILKASAAIPQTKDADIESLFSETRFEFDAMGRHTWTIYSIHRINNQAGTQDLTQISANYQPWHDKRPEMRARVISPDGSVHELDPKTIKEGPAKDEDEEDVYTDDRRVRAPLPAIAPGVIVEEWIKIEEDKPSFEGGLVFRQYFQRSYPMQHQHMEISAPTTLKIKFTNQLLPNEHVESKAEKDGINLYTFDLGFIEAEKDTENLTPPEVPLYPNVQFTTGTTWKDLATRYSHTVDEKIAASNIQEIATKAIVGKNTRAEKIAALMAWMHQEIRYTGIEFGQAAYIPVTPAETLKRKYGDCKDKSTLLVALLRAAGIPAHLALLETGPGTDLLSELPGMGIFDHAIVHVPGEPEYWIDATASYMALGVVPGDDQGRKALIVSPETESLTLIPESKSTENQTRELREFFMAEEGPSRVLETITLSGVSEAGYRSSYDDANLKNTRKNLEQYVKSTYLAESLGALEYGSNLKDLSKPFRLQIEALKVKRGTTDSTYTLTAILPWEIFRDLPETIRDPKKEDEEDENSKPAKQDEEKTKDKEKPPKPRKNDLVLPEAFVTEWSYRILPPAGFKAAKLPDNVKKNIGPAFVTWDFSLAPDGAILANFRFDTVKRRFTATEVEEMRKAIKDASKEQYIGLRSTLLAADLLQQNKGKEAIEEYRKLIALHPKEALHHRQFADALLKLGLGISAREEAHKAVELEPNSTKARHTLGWILQHDSLGRRFKPGFLYKEALAELKKAHELDPKEPFSAAEYAILLEHDDQGVMYSPFADMKSAFEVYKSMKDQMEELSSGLRNNPLNDLMWSHRWEELKKSAEADPQASSRDAMIVVAVAAMKGSDAAIQEAGLHASTDADKSKLLATAGATLLNLRMYPQAADLMTAGARGQSNSANVIARAEMFRSLKHHEDLPINENEPQSVVKHNLSILMSRQPFTLESLKQIMSHYSLEIQYPKETLRSLDRTRTSMLKTFQAGGTPLDMIKDVNVNTIQYALEGDDSTGFRIRVRSLGVNQPQTYYVIKENVGYRILGVNKELDDLGRDALSRLQKGDLLGARRWLDMAREELKLEGGEDPFAGPVFPRFWTKGKEGDAKAIATAATVLASGNRHATDLVPALVNLRDNATSETDKLNFEIALAQAYSMQYNLQGLQEVSKLLLQNSPESLRAFNWYTFASSYLGDWSATESAIADRQKRLPDDIDAIRAKAQMASLKEDGEMAKQAIQKMDVLGKTESSDLNSYAWAALLRGQVDDDVMKRSQESVVKSQDKNPSISHTLACLYAETGKPAQAREITLQALDVAGLNEPDSSFWYVFGRIAEQYGIVDEAKIAYQHVEEPEFKSQIPGSTYLLAQRRLKILESNQSKTH